MKYYLYSLIERFGALFCDAVASQNKEDLEIIKRYKRNAIYEGNGVDLQHLDRLSNAITTDELNRLREKYNISNQTKIILVGARFEPIKDHRFLLEGLRELDKKFECDFICLLVGEGELIEQVGEWIDELGLADKVKIVGYQANIYPFIKLADLVVLTSKKEGIPRIILEAMTFSKPVVASDVLGTRELVKNAETGFLVPNKNKDTLANKIYEVLTSKELQFKFGKNTRKLIEKEFTEQIVVNRLYMAK